MLCPSSGVNVGKLRSGDTCPGCGFKVPDKISIADAIKAAAKAKTPLPECGDRFPLCLNSAPIVQRYKDSDWTNIKLGVTHFRKCKPCDTIEITKREPVRTDMNFSPLYPAKVCVPDEDYMRKPGEHGSKAGKDASTVYSRLHHSTKCNGWIWRLSDDEWPKLVKSIIKPLLDVELEDLVYGTADLDARELKDPHKKKEVAIEHLARRPWYLHLIYYYPPKKLGLEWDEWPWQTWNKRPWFSFLGVTRAGWDGKPLYQVVIPYLREPTHYKKMSLAEAQEWHNNRLEYRRLKYIESILHPFQPQLHEFIDTYYKEKGKTNPDYYRIDSYLKKNRGYYKFPCYGCIRPIADHFHILFGRVRINDINITTGISCFDIPGRIECISASVHKSTLGIWPGRRIEKCDNPIYTVGTNVTGDTTNKYNSFYPGPSERDQFAKINVGLNVDLSKLREDKGESPVDFNELKPGWLGRWFKNFIKITPYYKKKIRWALGRGSYGSNHNERGKVVSCNPLDPRMIELLKRECRGESPEWVKNIFHIDSDSSCKYCGGVVRYSDRLELICDSCSSSFGFRIDDNEHIEERELSGDDDAWKTDEMLRVEAEEKELKLTRNELRRLTRLEASLKADKKLQKYEVEGKRQEKECRRSSYIKSDYRSRKKAHLECQIYMLLAGGDGVYQRDLGDMLIARFKTHVSERTIQRTIRRMEEAGNVSTENKSVPKIGKRIYVRLIPNAKRSIY